MVELIERDELGRWMRGTSGNPQGRPVIARPVRSLARRRSREAVAVLTAFILDPAAPARDRVAAACELLRWSGVRRRKRAPG